MADDAPAGATPAFPVLPYGRQWIDDDDVEAVVRVLRSDWLTTGPEVDAFEAEFAASCGVAHAVAFCNGTAALHGAMHALGIGPGDEVIVPPMTFAASANCVLYQGGTPVFADVDPGTLLLDPARAEAAVTPRTRAIVAVDYAGHPCDYDALREVADRHGLRLVADACHAAGGEWRGRAVGSLADLTAFSFHPVKHITTAEGGMVTTADPELARRMRVFRSHGITSDHRSRERAGGWFYEMVDLGYNYRITDVQCALGRSQLRKLGGWVARRRELAAAYDEALSALPGIHPLRVHPEAGHAYHLYVVRVREDEAGIGRDALFSRLRERGIGCNVHYVPVHLHPYYRAHQGTAPGTLPVAEAAYGEILSLPMFPRMTDADLRRVAAALEEVLAGAAAPVS